MVRKVDAIILAHGLIGRREKFPKAILEIEGKSLIERQISWLEPYVKNVIVACSIDESNLIKNYLKAKGYQRKIIYSTSNEPLGTAGALKKAFDIAMTDDVIVINVDDLTDIDIRALISFGTNTLCVVNPRLQYGMIELEGQVIKNFREKPILSGVWVSCGVYFISKNIKEKLPTKGSLERDIFPYIKLRAYKHYGSWHTVGGLHSH